jgi:hypothetical protein
MWKTSDYTKKYRHQDPKRNDERMYQKRRRKPQMDKDKNNENRQRKLELRNK